MIERFGGVFRGVRPLDGLLAGGLAALGAWLMVENIQFTDAHAAAAVADGSMVHVLTSHSWAMLPVFLLASIPVLWWRRNLVAVAGVALAVIVVHDLLFGWVTRCGAGLPLVFVLAYLGGAALDRTRALIVLGLTCLLTVAVLAVDATTGLEPAMLAFPILVILFVVGRAVRRQIAMRAELEARTAELRELRDDRAALEVGSARVRLSRELDGLLQQRLTGLAAAAEAGPDLDPATAMRLFASIEADSRATLDSMRDIVGLLRDGDVALAPAPTVAHLEAVLSRHSQAHAELTVVGDPRSLPAAVELSAYRIVEHLVDVLTDEPGSRIEVAVRFDPDSLEINVRGPVNRLSEFKAAVARARERTTFLGGSLDVRLSRGQARAIALLPLAG